MITKYFGVYIGSPNFGNLPFLAELGNLPCQVHYPPPDPTRLAEVEAVLKPTVQRNLTLTFKVIG